MRYRASKTALSPQAVFLLTVPRRFLCCSSLLLVRMWYRMWLFFFYYYYYYFFVGEVGGGGGGVLGVWVAGISICSISCLHLVPREGCALCLGHFLVSSGGLCFVFWGISWYLREGCALCFGAFLGILTCISTYKNAKQKQQQQKKGQQQKTNKQQKTKTYAADYINILTIGLNPSY